MSDENKDLKSSEFCALSETIIGPPQESIEQMRKRLTEKVRKERAEIMTTTPTPSNPQSEPTDSWIRSMESDFVYGLNPAQRTHYHHVKSRLERELSTLREANEQLRNNYSTLLKLADVYCNTSDPDYGPDMYESLKRFVDSVKHQAL